MNQIAEKQYFEVHYKMAPFIDAQNSKEMKAMRLGRCRADFNACEAIATYNVLACVRMQMTDVAAVANDAIAFAPNDAKAFFNSANCAEAVSFSEVLYAYEKKGLMLNGIFGVDPFAIYKYLNTFEFLNVKMIKGDDYKMFSFDECPKAAIITVFNNKKSVKAGIHTVSILQNDDGKYFILNSLSVSSKKTFETLKDAVIAFLGSRAKMICLITANML